MGRHGHLLVLAMAHALPAFAEEPTRETALHLDTLWSSDESPTVAVKSGGRTLRFVVDTGAHHTFLNATVGPVATMRAARSEALGIDAFGRVIAGYPVDSVGTLDGWGALRGHVVTSAWLDSDRRRGADGILAPLDLVEEGRALLIDLPGRRMASVSWEEAERQQEERGLALGKITITDGKLLVNVRVNGEPRVMAIDTGASRSALWVPHRDDLPASLSRRTLRTARLAIGQVVARLDVDEIEAVGAMAAGFDGLLGMDVLRDCVLALDAERATARCGRVEPPSYQRWRRTVIQANQGGPELVQRNSGGFRWSGIDYEAIIDEKGTVHVRRRAEVRVRKQYERTDDRTELRWFLDSTQELRFQLWRDEEGRLASESLAGLPSLLSAIWHDDSRTAEDRRRLLLELWDDCVEPDDPSLGWAGRNARQQVERYVRHRLPAGSPDSFTPDELARFNSKRPRAPYFEPYTPPKDVDLASNDRRQ